MNLQLLACALFIGLLNASLYVVDVNSFMIKYCRGGDLGGIESVWSGMSPRQRTDHIPICLNEAMNTGRLEVFEWVLSRPEAQVMDLSFLDLLRFGQTKSATSFICAIQRHLNMKEAFLRNCKTNNDFEVYRDLRHFKFDPTYLEEGLLAAWQNGSYQSAIEIVNSEFSDRLRKDTLEHVFLQACSENVPGLVSALLPRVDPATQYNAALCLATDYGYEEILSCLLRDPRVDPLFSNNYLFHYIVGYANPAVVYLLMSDRRFFLSEAAIISAINDENTVTAGLLMAHPHASVKFLSSLCDRVVEPDSSLSSLLPLIEAIRCIKTERNFDMPILDDDTFGILLLVAGLNGKHKCLSSLLNKRVDNPNWIKKIYRLAEKLEQTKALLVFNSTSQTIETMNRDKFSINARVFDLCSWQATGSLQLLVGLLCRIDAKVKQYMKELGKEQDVNKNADSLERHIYSHYVGLKGIQGLLRNANAVYFVRAKFKVFLPPNLIDAILRTVKKSLTIQ